MPSVRYCPMRELLDGIVVNRNSVGGSVAPALSWPAQVCTNDMHEDRQVTPNLWTISVRTGDFDPDVEVVGRCSTASSGGDAPLAGLSWLASC
jgi:hypothetical protein